ncbi:MAG: toxin [Candidatus Omnitrophota bacterium]
MKEFRWDLEKSKKLKETRGFSFEEIIEGKLISVEKHLVRENQKVLLFEHETYIWVIPCIIEKDYIFLKTAFPSRKYTRKHKGGDKK